MLCICGVPGVARELLDADIDSLESTTRKFRETCQVELQAIAVSGCVRSDGRVRGCLILAAGLIRLDIQELEGLNSMVKVAVARSNNNRITLELLTARVCTRKVLALHTDGAIRYKSVIPCAASLARSAYLHYGNHLDLLRDTTRWDTCCDANLPAGDPAIYNPALRPSAEHKWAMKYNSHLMKRLRAHDKDKLRLKGSVLSLLLPGPAAQGNAGHGHNPAAAAADEVWICCAITRSQAMMMKGRLIEGGKISLDSSEQAFMLSAALIASTYKQVESVSSTGARLKLHTQVFKAAACESGMVLAQQGEPSLLCELRGRYKRADASTDAAGILADGASEDEELSGEEEEYQQVGDLQNISKDEQMKMIMGWDDELSNDDDCDSGNDGGGCTDVGSDDEHMGELESLNVKIAISAADQQSEADFEGCTDRIAEDCDCFKGSTFSTLSPVEAETEAYLQEILLSRQHMHDEQGDDTPVPAARVPPNKAAHEHRHDSFMPEFKPTASAVDDFRRTWRNCFRDACTALEYMRDNSGRQLGDNGSLNAVGLGWFVDIYLDHFCCSLFACSCCMLHAAHWTCC